MPPWRARRKRTSSSWRAMAPRTACPIRPSSGSSPGGSARPRGRIVAWLDDHLAAAVSELRAGLGEATPCVLLAHYTASGARFGGYRGSLHGREIEIPPSALRNPAFDYVALGHIHRHQRIGMP